MTKAIIIILNLLKKLYGKQHTTQQINNNGVKAITIIFYLFYIIYRILSMNKS